MLRLFLLLVLSLGVTARAELKDRDYRGYRRSDPRRLCSIPMAGVRASSGIGGFD